MSQIIIADDNRIQRHLIAAIKRGNYLGVDDIISKLT